MSAEPGTVWTRGCTGAKSAPALSVESIVAAAIEIADAEGLDAVSIRRVAAKLGVRPMSFYSHIERKEDLVDLMFDEAIGGSLLPDGVPSDWREALRQIAGRTREVMRGHPWMATIANRRRMLGPNALRHIDQSMAAVANLELPPARRRAALRAVDAYTFGHAHWEAKKAQMALDPATEEAEEIDAYLDQMASSGEYPHLGEICAADFTIGDGDASFEAGLEWLLAGIAAEAEAAKSRR